MKMQLKTFRGGVHVPDHKEPTHALPIVEAAAPSLVYIPMSMHIGAPAKPLVAVGDYVKMGQKIGEAGGFVSAPIHASVSGTVKAIQQMPVPNGRYADAIVIENDFQDQWETPPAPVPQAELDAMSGPELTQRVQEMGIVGMGGATFPTHVKYAPSKDGKQADVVILNGIECEPYVTADHRVMLEQAERVVAGLGYLMRMSNCPRGVIAIEANKPDAFEAISKLVAGRQGMEAVLCKEKYPEGSEKQLIQAITGREVPPGGLPLDVGVIVSNVSTAAAVADALEQGIPLIRRVVTVSGDAVTRPANYLVRIGTLYSDLVEQCGGTNGPVTKIISGGPMMGFSVYTDQIPVLKGTSGILLFHQASQHTEGPCVRCGRCVTACPMRLEPTSMMKAVKLRNWDKAKALDITSCMECGSCTFVCPSTIPLVQYFRLGKQYVTSKDGNAAVNPLL